MLRLALAVSMIIGLGACTAAPPSPVPSPSASPSPSPSSTPSPSASPLSHGPLGLINDLRAAGVEAEEDSEFPGEPISNLGMQICVEGEPVQVYVFGTAQEAQAVASRIDPHDPSNFGTAMIEWAGEPKFWLRDRILVLYLGTDEEVEDALVSLLGEPFARGEGRPPLRGPDDC